MPGETPDTVVTENGQQEVVTEPKAEVPDPATTPTPIKESAPTPTDNDSTPAPTVTDSAPSQDPTPVIKEPAATQDPAPVATPTKDPETDPAPAPTPVSNSAPEPELQPEPKAEPEPAAAPVIQQNGTNNAKKGPLSTSVDDEALRAAYDDVRSDSTETQWAVFKFEGNRILCSARGAEFEKFREQFTENERAFGYIRIQTGDEMSKRQKFLFVTWVGPSVSVLKRAKMSTDKSVVKNVISNFAVELQLENASEIDLGHFKDELNKAGGANYGTGVRDF